MWVQTHTSDSLYMKKVGALAVMAPLLREQFIIQVNHYNALVKALARSGFMEDELPITYWTLATDIFIQILIHSILSLCLFYPDARRLACSTLACLLGVFDWISMYTELPKLLCHPLPSMFPPQYFLHPDPSPLSSTRKEKSGVLSMVLARCDDTSCEYIQSHIHFTLFLTLAYFSQRRHQRRKQRGVTTTLCCSKELCSTTKIARYWQTNVPLLTSSDRRTLPRVLPFSAQCMPRAQSAIPNNFNSQSLKEHGADWIRHS